MKINNTTSNQNKQIQRVPAFNAKYMGIRIKQNFSNINRYPPEYQPVLKKQCETALRLLKQAKGLIKKEMKEIVEKNIPEDIPIQFEVHRFENGCVDLSMNHGYKESNELMWGNSIMPKENYDSFNHFYFKADGNPELDGFYIQKQPNINHGNTGGIKYSNLTTTDIKKMANFLKEQFLSAIRIHNSKNTKIFNSDSSRQI